MSELNDQQPQPAFNNKDTVTELTKHYRFYIGKQNLNLGSVRSSAGNSFQVSSALYYIQKLCLSKVLIELTWRFTLGLIGLQV
jgi:hypothetical protein